MVVSPLFLSLSLSHFLSLPPPTHTHFLPPSSLPPHPFLERNKMLKYSHYSTLPQDFFLSLSALHFYFLFFRRLSDMPYEHTYTHLIEHAHTRTPFKHTHCCVRWGFCGMEANWAFTIGSGAEEGEDGWGWRRLLGSERETGGKERGIGNAGLT